MAPTPENKTQPQLVTLGCRLNGYESERIGQLAGDAGLSEAIIVNTCAVTGEAVRQARQTIRRLHRDHPEKNLIVTGCAAQIDPESFAAMDEVSSVVGNHEKMTATPWQTIARTAMAEPMEKVQVNDIMAVTETAPQLLLEGGLSRVRSYVQIQNGCDHRCTFCIIPYGRGNSRSVPMGDVIREIRSLVDRGTAEVVLTGVDITSYGPDLPGTPTLGDLVRRILHHVPDLPRLRLSSIDGAEIDDTLFTLITTEERLAPHLHLSLQAGDNMILKRMKRRHTREQAIAFCRSVKKARPDVAFGADIIAGFPTETEDMFENSLRLIDECEIVFTHIFPYSARQGTPAARMPQLPKADIKARARRLREKGTSSLHHFLDGLSGASHTALIESAEVDRPIRARLSNFAEVILSPSPGFHPSAGDLVPVNILHREDNHLIASYHAG